MPGLAAVPMRPRFAHVEVQALSEAVTAIGWTPDGAVLIGCAGGNLYCCDAGGAAQRHWQAHTGGVTRIAVQPEADGILASAGEDGRVVLWNAREGARLDTLLEESEWVEHLEWTPDGKVLAAAARKTISLWRGNESIGMWYDARRRVLAMAWAPDGKRLATAANKGLYLWRMGSNAAGDAEPVQLLTFPGAPVAVAWQPDGKALAVGTQDGFLQVWRPAGPRTKARQLTMRGYPAKVSCLAWHPQRQLIATAGGPDVVLWEMPKSQGEASGSPLRHHKSTVTTLAWSPDGQLLASGDRSGRICLWEVHGEALHVEQLEHEVTALTWAPSGELLLAGDTAGRVHRFTAIDAGQEHNATAGLPSNLDQR